MTELGNRLDTLYDSIDGNLGARMRKIQEGIWAMTFSLAEARAASLTSGQVRALVSDEMGAVSDKLKILRQAVDDLKAFLRKQPKLGQDSYLALSFS